MEENVVERWFPTFLEELGAGDRLGEIAEVVSDCAKELHLNVIAARSLRSFGRSGNNMFWVRSEWGHVDISYGAAKEAFVDWDKAWTKGATGDLGQIEAKLVYQHLGFQIPLGTLAQQLQQRFERDRDLRDMGHAVGQNYHGIVWFVAHGSSARPYDIEKDLVTPATEWTKHAHPSFTWLRCRVLGSPHLEIWPNNPTYVAHLAVALLRFKPEGDGKTRVGS